MRTISAGLRTATQAENTKPTTTVKLLRRRLNFGSAYASVLGSFGDDYYDVGKEGIACDSAMRSSDGLVLRVTNWRAVSPSAASDAYICTAIPSGALTNMDTEHNTRNYGNTIYHRPGVCASDAATFAWFYSFGGHIYRRYSREPSEGWLAASDVGDAPTCTSLAIAPVSGTEYFICYLQAEKRMYVQRWYYDGTWQSDNAFMVGQSDYGWDDTHYFDVEQDPNDSNRRVIVYSAATQVANIRFWENGVYGEPYALLRSDQEYAYQNVRVTGISSIGNYLYAHVRRGLKSTDDLVYTPYSVVMRSSDGYNWASIGATGTLECRGKVHAYSDKVAVMGPATVMRADATTKIGTPDEVDITNKVVAWQHSFGEGKVATTATQIRDPSDTTLLYPGEEIRHYYGVDSETPELICVGTLDTPARRLANNADTYQVVSRGPKKALDNQSLADGLFESGRCRFYNFEPAHGMELHTGTWTTYRKEDVDGLNYVKYTGTEEDGSTIMGKATIPSYIDTDFHCAVEFESVTNLSPTYLVFWYEDEDNYWRFGHNGDTAFVIERVVAGVATQMDSQGIEFSADTKCRLKVVIRGGNIYGYVYMNSQWVEACTDEYDVAVAVGTSKIGVCCEAAEDDIVYFTWIWYKETRHDWTRGRLVKAICAQAGVEAEIDDTDIMTGASNLGSGYYMSNTKQREVDVEAVIDLSGGFFGVLMSGTTDQALANLSAYMLRISTTQVQLVSVTPTGAMEILQYALYNFPTGDTRVRATCFKQSGSAGGSWFNVWVNEQFAACFYIGESNPASYSGSSPERGYLGYYSSSASVTSVTAKSYPDYHGSYVWQRAMDASNTLRELLVGSMLRIVERTDGTVKLLKEGGDLGTYQHVVTEALGGGSDREWASVFRVTGEEVYVEYAHEPLLSRGERVMGIDVHYLWSEAECLEHAIEMAEYVETLLNSRDFSAPIDPALETCDTFTLHADIEGSAYNGIVVSGTFTVKDGSGKMQITSRSQLGTRDGMAWDTDNWDEGYWR